MVAGGCSLIGADGDITVRTDQNRYEVPADTAVLTLESETDETINGPLCGARLHRQLTADHWKAVEAPFPDPLGRRGTVRENYWEPERLTWRIAVRLVEGRPYDTRYFDRAQVRAFSDKPALRTAL